MVERLSASSPAACVAVGPVGARRRGGAAPAGVRRRVPFRLLRALAPLAVALLAAGCATTPRGPPRCEDGAVEACLSDGWSAQARGDTEAAEAAFGAACAAGDVPGCLAQGRLLVARGDLERAEPPLQRAQEAGWGVGYRELASVLDARGRAEDGERARRLRWEGLAVEHPAAEIITGFRAYGAGGWGSSLALNLQPMAWGARRLGVGVQVVLPPGAASIDLFARYQHFAAEWLVPYVGVRAGSTLHDAQGTNVGADLGVKLALAPVGHLDLSLGVSRAGGVHASAGIGFDWVLALLAALQ